MPLIVHDNATAVIIQAHSGALAVDGFENGDLSFSSDNFDWTSTRAVANGEESSVVVTNEHAHTGTYSLRFTFGATSNEEDAWAEQRFALGSNMTELWLRWYQYFPDGTEGLGPKWQHRDDVGADNNKFLRLWDEIYTSPDYDVKCGFSFQVGSNGDSHIIAEYGSDGNGVGTQGDGSTDNPDLPWALNVVTDDVRGR